MTGGTESRTVKSVQLTLDIIDYLQTHQSAGVTELAEELDRSKGSVHGHLATLAENEYIVNKDDTYRLSLRYLELGETVKSRISIYDVAVDELNDLAGESGELAQFAMEEHGQVVYVYKTGGQKAVQTASSVGNREFMHCISLGKAMLAHMSKQRVDEIIDQHGLEPATENTITSKEKLLDELSNVEDQGYAFDREEKIEGLRCVAAPVMMGNDVLGAISISGPASRFEGEFYEEELPRMVTRSANVIEINSQFS